MLICSDSPNDTWYKMRQNHNAKSLKFFQQTHFVRLNSGLMKRIQIEKFVSFTSKRKIISVAVIKDKSKMMLVSKYYRELKLFLENSLVG